MLAADISYYFNSLSTVMMALPIHIFDTNWLMDDALGDVHSVLATALSEWQSLAPKLKRFPKYRI